MLIRYEVEYYDEIDRQEHIEKGLTTSKTTLGEGVDKIAKYYGKDNIGFIKVYECFDVLSDEELLEIINENT